MEDINFQFLGKGKGFHITDFPDAEKVLAIKGEKVQKTADLALHRNDLDRSAECLKLLSQSPKDSFQSGVFWRMAVIYFYRCFKGNNARSYHLDPNIILKNDSVGLEVFEYFKNLRNQNIVHDDNAIDQCIPGAILNKKITKHKIAKIITFKVGVETYDDVNVNNLKLLIEKARKFVVKEFDKTCDELTKDLESMTYDDLNKMDALKYSKPDVIAVKESRKKLL